MQARSGIPDWGWYVLWVWARLWAPLQADEGGTGLERFGRGEPGCSGGQGAGGAAGVGEGCCAAAGLTVLAAIVPHPAHTRSSLRLTDSQEQLNDSGFITSSTHPWSCMQSAIQLVSNAR